MGVFHHRHELVLEWFQEYSFFCREPDTGRHYDTRLVSRKREANTGRFVAGAGEEDGFAAEPMLYTLSALT